MIRWVINKLNAWRADREWEMEAGKAWYDQPATAPQKPVSGPDLRPSAPGVVQPDAAYSGFLAAQDVARFVAARCGDCAGCRNGYTYCAQRDGRSYIDNDPYRLR